jgi:GrpB-like predicted nucleotidyltransferase (UPF0157 family)
VPVVASYRTDWPDRAEHIGSTSIPGMAANDVLDMQVRQPVLRPQLGCASTAASLCFDRS